MQSHQSSATITTVTTNQYVHIVRLRGSRLYHPPPHTDQNKNKYKWTFSSSERGIFGPIPKKSSIETLAFNPCNSSNLQM